MSIGRIPWASVFASAVASAGCGLPTVEWEDLEWKGEAGADLGSICVIPAGDAAEEAVAEALGNEPTPQDFVADAPLFAVHGVCFSSTCTRNVEMSLEADGTDFSSQVSAEFPVPIEGLACVADCVMHYLTLDLVPLAEGAHVVTFGDDSITLQVPGTQRACLGAYPFGSNDLRPW